jgi:hypothetical protein
MVTPELGKAFWSVSTFVNRYVKGADGKWRIREMRIFPDVKADYYQGWHLSQVVDTAPTGLLAPDRPSGANQSPPLAETAIRSHGSDHRRYERRAWRWRALFRPFWRGW